jgi:hypothetical protein
MTRQSALSQWSTMLRKHWLKLTSTAGFIIAIVGGFIKPVGTSDEESNVLIRFTPVAVALVVGIVYLLARRLGPNKYRNFWFAATILNVVLFVTGFFVYRNYVYTRTCEFDNDRVLIGTSYTSHTIKYLSTNQGISCSKLLDNFGGKSEDIWTAESINESRRFRDFSYFSGVTLFALSFLTLGQALAVDSENKDRSGVPRRARPKA